MSRITDALVETLKGQGIDASTSSAKRKKAAQQILEGDPLTKAEMKELAAAFSGDGGKKPGGKKSSGKKSSGKKKTKKEPAAKAAPSSTELMSQAEAYVKQMKKEEGEPWTRVVSVVEASNSGRPIRVVIGCVDPQVTGSGDSVCESTREIAIQDLFQVVRCRTCQKRYTQLFRNELARKRRARQKGATAASKPAAKKSKAKKSKKAKK